MSFFSIIVSLMNFQRIVAAVVVFGFFWFILRSYFIARDRKMAKQGKFHNMNQI